MTLDELRSLDPNNPGSWPFPVRVTVVAMIFIAVVGGGYWFVGKNMIVESQRFKAEEVTLRAQFEQKAHKASALKAYRTQLEEMKIKFGAMLRQLPGESEVANLLQDISQTRVESGLEENLFKPGKEARREFYAELPIKIEFVGLFHDYGRFMQGLGELSRIVTLHDLQLKLGKVAEGASGRKVPITLTATAKTYRYLEEDE